MLFNSYEIVPIYFKPKLNKNTEFKNSLKLISINVLKHNRKYKILENYVLKNDPDILVLSEMNRNWLNNIPEIKKKYNYKSLKYNYYTGDVIVFSKIKLINTEIIKFGNDEIKSIRTKLNINNKEIEFVAIHPLSPVSKMYNDSRNSLLNGIIKKYKNSNKKERMIIVGDFNITPYSYRFKKIIKELNLYDSRKGFGIHRTFKNFISIDHCLLSKNIKVNKRKVGENIGSDHRPIVLEISF